MAYWFLAMYLFSALAVSTSKLEHSIPSLLGYVPSVFILTCALWYGDKNSNSCGLPGCSDSVASNEVSMCQSSLSLDIDSAMSAYKF